MLVALAKTKSMFLDQTHWWWLLVGYKSQTSFSSPTVPV